MSSVFPFVTRRRFLAFLGGVPALLFVARCAPVRRNPDDETYFGPFFSDGSKLVE